MTLKTDAQVRHDVMAELGWEPSIDASHIGVGCSDGVVTLTGHVGSFPPKWQAGQAAQRVAGVRALALEIKVVLPGTSRRSDADIAHAAGNALLWMTTLPGDTVQVMVEDGWITLSGHVEWDWQRQAASGAMRYLMGATGVSNQLLVRPTLPMTALKADIEATLKRRAHADAPAITVSVSGSEVTLSGTVHDWSERELAMQSAWSTPGVRNVVDHTNTIP